MEKIAAVITERKTQGAFVVTMDYGKDGSGTVVVHKAPCTPPEAAENRRELNRVLLSFGYEPEMPFCAL